MRELETCEICREAFDPEELTSFGGMQLCAECLNSATMVCDHCGTRLWREDNAGDNDTYLCRSCYENHYVTCSWCERIIREDDAHYEDEDTPMCYDCYRQQANRYTIQPYGYKPVPVFFGEGERYMGVELELDGAGETDANARVLMELANSAEEHIYIKHDGSLDDGFEVVSHPMTLDYHMNRMPWAEVLEKAREMGYKSHQARTCGLHIHINRTAFGDTEAETEAVIARLLYFFEKHWEELLKFSHRTQRQVEQWANRYGYKNEPMEILDHAKKGFRGVRYTAVNLTNAATIELRLFRGTDATGIAYNAEGGLRIYKRPMPAHLLWFRVPEDTKVVMGHTRMTTQGTELFNQNNHPFGGRAGDSLWLWHRELYNRVAQYWKKVGVLFPLTCEKINEHLDSAGLIKVCYETRGTGQKRLFVCKSSLPGRSRMLVLNERLAREYLEKESD